MEQNEKRIKELEKAVEELTKKLEAMERRQENELWYIERDINRLFRLCGV